MKKLAVIQTHPVQYYSPLYKLLSERGNIQIKVFYTWFQWQTEKMDKSFGRVVEWDVPILEGYEYSFVENEASSPGLHFRGIHNPGLWKELNDWGANAILVYGWNYRSHLQLMKKAKGKIPVFFRGDSHLLNKEFFLKSILKKAFLKWVYKQVDLAFYVGSHNRRYFQTFGIPSERLVHAPHAVENSFFENTDFLDDLRKNIEYKSNDFVILFVGKLEPVKDPETLLKAFINLKSKTYCKLVFVGEGPLKNELQEKASGHKNVYFLGFQNQSYMPSVYALGNILVLPSISETWGLAINEAMAAGRAIVASDKVGCATDLVQEGKNGFVFAAGNAVELRNRLEIFLENKKKAETFGKASENIIKDWSFEKIAKVLEEKINLI